MKKRTQYMLFLYGFTTIGILMAGFVIWEVAKDHVFYSYTDTKTGMFIKYPARWKLVIDPAGGADVAFVTKRESDLDLFQDNVNLVRRPLKDDTVGSLQTYALMVLNQLKMIFSSLIEIQESEELFMANQPAYKIVFTAHDPQMEYKIMIVFMIKHQKVYQFTYTASSSTYDKYYEKVQKMMESFRVN